MGESNGLHEFMNELERERQKSALLFRQVEALRDELIAYRKMSPVRVRSRPDMAGFRLGYRIDILMSDEMILGDVRHALTIVNARARQLIAEIQRGVIPDDDDRLVRNKEPRDAVPGL